MGYSHYWRRSFILPKARFELAVADIQKILPESGVSLVKRYQSRHPAYVGKAKISFNGEGEEDACEDFVVNRVEKPRPGCKDWYAFEFCKTRRSLYDLPVTASLIILDHHLPEDFMVSSDGDELEWAAARELTTRVLGYGKNFQLVKDANHDLTIMANKGQHQWALTNKASEAKAHAKTT